MLDAWKQKYLYWIILACFRFLVWLNFDREEGSDVPLRNIEVSPNYTTV
jgi:hypothetical protein